MINSSEDGSGSLVTATPHIRKKHTGRWSNVSMEVNTDKSKNHIDLKR